MGSMKPRVQEDRWLEEVPSRKEAKWGRVRNVTGRLLLLPYSGGVWGADGGVPWGRHGRPHLSPNTVTF